MAAANVLNGMEATSTSRGQKSGVNFRRFRRGGFFDDDDMGHSSRILALLGVSTKRGEAHISFATVLGEMTSPCLRSSLQTRGLP